MEPKTILCISCYYKGYDFMEQMHRLGNKVILITSENIKDKNWPWHALDEVFYMQEESPSVWNLTHLVQGFSYLMQHRKIDAVVALDDYDVEKAALLRETFRISGMGQTTHRYFRDKLAMRQKALKAGIRVPEFTAIFNDQEVEEFTQKVSPPWVLKPRSEASASGIKKIFDKEKLWEAIKGLEEQRHLFLLESFKPGDVFHVDSLTYNEKVVFTSASKYLSPPLQVSHQGGVFRSKTLDINSSEFKSLESMGAALLKEFGLQNGATHTEFIHGEDNEWYFLETSSRVGGAHIPDLVEASTGINIWHEWANIEDALLKNKQYKIKERKNNFAGLLIALSKNDNPSMEEFQSPEIEKFLHIPNHIGMVFKSKSSDQIDKSLDSAMEKVLENYLQILPPKEKPLT